VTLHIVFESDLLISEEHFELLDLRILGEERLLHGVELVLHEFEVRTQVQMLLGENCNLIFALSSRSFDGLRKVIGRIGLWIRSGLGGRTIVEDKPLLDLVFNDRIQKHSLLSRLIH